MATAHIGDRVTCASGTSDFTVAGIGAEAVAGVSGRTWAPRRRRPTCRSANRIRSADSKVEWQASRKRKTACRAEGDTQLEAVQFIVLCPISNGFMARSLNLAVVDHDKAAANNRVDMLQIIQILVGHAGNHEHVGQFADL